MFIAARGFGALAIGFLSPACQCNNHGSGAPGERANLGCGLKSIELGHAHIHQDEVGPKPIRLLHRLRAIVRGTHFVSHHGEEHRKRLGGVEIVIRNQHPAPYHGGTCSRRRNAWDFVLLHFQCRQAHGERAAETHTVAFRMHRPAVHLR